MKEREWLKDMRLKAAMTQSDVAKICGISQAEYCRIERGSKTPRPALAQTMGRLFGFQWTRFFEEVAA